MSTTRPRFELVDALEGLVDDFARAVAEGLSAAPKSLPCRFFYDEEGSRLFEAICELEEYYPTRAEREILAARADELAERFAGRSVIELGSGSAEKTELLLAALCRRAARGDDGPVAYAPIDISADALARSGERLVAEHPELEVTAFAAEYRRGLALALEHLEAPHLVAWFGGNVGNYTRAAAAAQLRGFRDLLSPTDALLLGADLRKDRRTLELAYDDPSGVTAAFNRNILARANRELGADFDLDAFAHEARYDEAAGVVRIHLVSLRAQTVRIGALDATFRFAAGERIHTEDSTKYSFAELDALAAAAGFAPVERWTDAATRFALALWRPAA